MCNMCILALTEFVIQKGRCSYTAVNENLHRFAISNISSVILTTSMYQHSLTLSEYGVSLNDDLVKY